MQTIFGTCDNVRQELGLETNQSSVEFVHDRAKSRMDNISIYHEASEFAKAMAELELQKALFFIETPTSKPRICAAYLQLVGTLANPSDRASMTRL